MNDHSRILMAIGGLAIGPTLAAAGSYLLGTARAVARHTATERRRRADLGQYAAALLALVGFLALAGGAGLLAAQLIPGTETVRLVAGGVTGVVVFTVAGVLFSRLADASEDSRVRKIPAPAYLPGRGQPALPAGPGAYGTPSTAPGTLPPAVAAAIAAQRAPSTSAAPAYVPMEPPASVPVSAMRSAIPMASSSAGQWPGAHEGEPTFEDSALSADGTAFEQGVPGQDDAVGESDSAADPYGRGPGTPAATDGFDDQAEDRGSAEAMVVESPEQLVERVRPGWVYRDAADQWYLGVGSSSGALLRLPEFALVLATDPQYPLVIAGAGEISVVPLEDEPPTGHLTD